jgi:SAM-dependent methyltransferase
VLASSVDEIVARLRPDDRVLDVGGWYVPFKRADYVADILPYATRGQGYGPGHERFSAETWVRLDICRDSLPFDDGFFDFVVCSQTLEDVRDPLFVCAELNRVAKAGYLETPSITAELSFGIESLNYAGYQHHRWLVEMRSGGVTFRNKPHYIHSSWRYHLPKRTARALTPEQRASFLFWEGQFAYEEAIVLTLQESVADIGELVRGAGQRPAWVYELPEAGPAIGRLRGSVGPRVIMSHMRKVIGS